MLERVGLGESPAGSNRNEITREFGLTGPWCAMTVSLAYKHGAGVVLGALEARHHTVWGYWPGRGFAYVPALEAWLKSAGWWVGRATPQRGDIAIFQWPGTTAEPDHTGLVTGAPRGGRVPTVEGNAGDALRTESRDPATIVGYGRVRAHK
jgi:CHAP domain-containing protein